MLQVTSYELLETRIRYAMTMEDAGLENISGMVSLFGCDRKTDYRSSSKSRGHRFVCAQDVING